MFSKIEILLLIFCLHSYLGALASDPDAIQDFCILNAEVDSHSHTKEACKPSTQITPDDFVFSGVKAPGNFSDDGLSAILVTPNSFPGLNTLGMSFVRFDYQAGGINPPHYHSRATEIAFVVKGKVYAGLVDSNNRVYAKVIEEGEVMVFPKGLVHFQMNVGKSPATIYASFNSQNPGVQRIPSTIFGSGINDELLEKAFGISIKQIGKMRRKFFP
ncbi:OLC1v1034228C1 [Oldenlandia corymbosa var. corymbosa]|uniref:Germin-like protein n=1 Tax=Oldenlandia corymbosa var. corymbosa TaxID=529605 RepID=A0AAV1CQU5_OLDCO|nr:OLC1v1034228C1 [Oldenlandia corymbosa var. corymbosa]